MRGVAAHMKPYTRLKTLVEGEFSWVLLSPPPAKILLITTTLTAVEHSRTRKDIVKS